MLSFRAGRAYDDNHAKANKLARIYTITKEIALTAAKLEASAIDLTTVRDQVDNRRRKWDCFHIATAMQLGCGCLYSIDEGMLARRSHLAIKGMDFLPPVPRSLDLFPESDISVVQ